MKPVPLMVFALALALSACSDDGIGPEGADLSAYSGTFYVTFVVVESNCAIAPPLDGNATITIRGDEIVWGSMIGSWEEEAKRGAGGSPSPTCIPINPGTGCEGCFTTSFDIVFASVDSFTGGYGAKYAYSPSCGTDSCHTYYSITGTR